MEQYKNLNNNSTVVCDTTTKVKKNYQKYFDTPKANTIVVNKTKTVAYSRAKLVLITLYIVLGLMLSLFITNFFIIAGMNSNIETSKYAIMQEQYLSEEYINSIQNAINAGALDDRFNNAGYVSGEMDNTDLAFGTIFVKENEEIQPQTNWFNELTNFISKIFGG